MKAMKERAVAINEAMTAKAVETMDLKEEKDSLQKILEDIAEELEQRKIQVQSDHGVEVLQGKLFLTNTLDHIHSYTQ